MEFDVFTSLKDDNQSRFHSFGDECRSATGQTGVCGRQPAERDRAGGVDGAAAVPCQQRHESVPPVAASAPAAITVRPATGRRSATTRPQRHHFRNSRNVSVSCFCLVWFCSLSWQIDATLIFNVTHKKKMTVVLIPVKMKWISRY